MFAKDALDGCARPLASPTHWRQCLPPAWRPPSSTPRQTQNARPHLHNKRPAGAKLNLLHVEPEAQERLEEGGLAVALPTDGHYLGDGEGLAEGDGGGLQAAAQNGKADLMSDDLDVQPAHHAPPRRRAAGWAGWRGAARTGGPRT